MTITRALTWIGVVLVLGIAGVLLLATTRPPNLRVVRSAIINAPPARIHALIDDFHQWSAWSPYDKADPAMKKRFSGAAAGKGAVFEWEGNRRVGSGRMENIESTVPSRVVVKLDFARPIEGHNVAEFTLVPDGGSTRVTWLIDGPASYPGKLAGIFLDMDQLIGNDFDAGLANLKALSEK